MESFPWDEARLECAESQVLGEDCSQGSSGEVAGKRVPEGGDRRMLCGGRKCDEPEQFVLCLIREKSLGM